jgi:hypothetical protein
MADLEPIGRAAHGRPARAGHRFRERTKPPGGAREFEQITEVSEFERPSRLGVHVVEGPQPFDGTWNLEPDRDGTRVTFLAEGELRGRCASCGRWSSASSVRRLSPQPAPQPRGRLARRGTRIL